MDKAVDNLSKDTRSSLTLNSQTSIFNEGWLSKLHKVGENPQISEDLRQAHVKATNGKVHTRFPPEPNGYLHIGHTKAIAIDFGYARYHGGSCYLRYDDTNPEKEKEEYFDQILETVKWLGFEPWKITYSSNYFPQLYHLAEKLIERGKGYVCHCTGAQIHESRGGDNGGPRHACEHRDRPIAESLKEFRAMRDGNYRPNEAILRMKQDLTVSNPQMWDLIAYRVLEQPHHRTGSTWKVYPTYDFTHCLVDSMENITHSLCTTEFILSRVSYEWLCDALEVYKPRQSEFGRLRLTGTVLSKRKIQKLIADKYVRGWDDPRLYTIAGLRRRGVPPGALLAFVNELGVTPNITTIETAKFDSVLRLYIQDIVPRLMIVFDPIPIVLENLDDDYLEDIEIPYKMIDDSMGTRTVPFTKRIYIERDDFRAEASKSFFRLTPTTKVGLLKVPRTIRVNSFSTDANGNVTEIRAHYENDVDFKKPKAYIHWVAESSKHKSPIRIKEARMYNPLLKPAANGSTEEALDMINENSEIISQNVLAEVGLNLRGRKFPVNRA